MVSFADKPTLTGGLVVLRPVRVEDAPGLLALDEEARRLTGTHATHPLDRLERWYATRAEHDDRLDLAVVAREDPDDRWLGEVVLLDLDEDNLSCGFRIVLGADGRGRGYGSEATRLVLDHAFRTVGLHRVELEVYAFNPRARHVYERAGFVHEGTRRHALRWDGEWVDAHGMGLLADEWLSRGRPAAAPASGPR